jgi:hypothetical protein
MAWQERLATPWFECVHITSLTNTGVRSDISYVKGIHNIKLGGVYEQTFLTENDKIGIVDPTQVPGTMRGPTQPSHNGGTSPRE